MARTEIADPARWGKPAIPASRYLIGIFGRIAGRIGLRDFVEVEFGHYSHPLQNGLRSLGLGHD